MDFGLYTSMTRLLSSCGAILLTTAALAAPPAPSADFRLGPRILHSARQWNDFSARYGTPLHAGSDATLTVDPGHALRTLDGRLYGLNVLPTDGLLNAARTQTLLADLQPQTLRFPGGSAADAYDWSRSTSAEPSPTLRSAFPAFARLAETLHSQAFVTVNYGSGTPEMAAAWVAYANGSPANAQRIGTDSTGRDWKTVGHWAALRAAAPLAQDDGYNFLRVSHPAPYHIQSWEIGNECYGAWELDRHGVPGSGLTGAAHDPATYAAAAAQFARAMKSVDPSIKLGLPAFPDDDNPAYQAWTPTVLAALHAAGTRPDFLEDHRYPQEPQDIRGQVTGESDAMLLQMSAEIKDKAAGYRRMLRDVLGNDGDAVELVVTEANSVTYNPGKQTTSLVNGLYLADSLGQMTQTEFRACAWADFHSGAEAGHNNSPALYGWRPFGDYGMVAAGDRPDTPADTPYPTYYAAKLLTHWAKGGDRIVEAASDHPLLTVYAARRADGSLALLVINKDPRADLTGHFEIALPHAAPSSVTATLYQYGKGQDTARADAQQSPVALTPLAAVDGLSLDGGHRSPAPVKPNALRFNQTFPAYSVTVLTLPLS